MGVGFARLRLGTSRASPQVVLRSVLLFLASARTSVLVLAACASPTEITVIDGNVLQHTWHQRYAARQPLEIVVIVDTGTSDAGAALRESVAEAVRRFVRRRAADSRDLWNPVEARAIVVDAAAGSLAPPISGARLTWSEPNATSAGAEAFGDALASTIRDLPRREATGSLAALVESKLAIARASTTTERLVVIAAVQDDTRASDEPAPLPWDNYVTLVVPAKPSPGPDTCTPIDVPNLGAWSWRWGNAAIQAPCDEFELRTLSLHTHSMCLPQRVVSLSESPRCRVTAIVARGTKCERERGWSPLPGRTASPDAPAAEMHACEVLPVEPEDSASCLNRHARYAGASSGWCLPPGDVFCAHPGVRAVGGAAPPSALIEITCELATEK